MNMSIIRCTWSLSVPMALMVLLSSCGSQKKVTPTVNAPQQIHVKVPDNTLIEALSPYSTGWQRVKLPMTINLRQPIDKSVSGQVIMERNKSITISLKFFGMEIGLLHLTSDSIIAIDKFNKRYLAEPLQKFLGGFPVNISNVQSLLIGQPFLLGSCNRIIDDRKQFDFEPPTGAGAMSLLIPRKMPHDMEYGFSLNQTLQLARLIIKSGSNPPVTVSYGEPVASAAGPFSSQVSIKAKTGKTAIEAAIDWKIQKAKWDSDVGLRNVTIGSGYQRIDAAKLLKSLSNL